jgi:hypothetical protein
MFSAEWEILCGNNVIHDTTTAKQPHWVAISVTITYVLTPDALGASTHANPFPNVQLDILYTDP